MAQILTAIGEEYIHKFAFRQDQVTRDAPEEIRVGVFDQSNDSVGQESDYDGSSGDITTEPTDGNYSEKYFSLDGSDISIVKSGGNYVMDIKDHDFDMINTTGSADHYFILGKFQSDETSDSSQNWHLLAIGPLEQSYDLNSVDTLTNKDAGISLD